MRKLLSTLLALLALLAILAGIVVFRAQTQFPDIQVAPAQLTPLPLIDEDGAVERLAAALRIPTVSSEDRSQLPADAFGALHEHLEASFPLVHRRAEREVVNDFSVLYTLEGNDPTLDPVLFAAHQDVVPVDPDSTWQQPPFSGSVVDGEIWGRGALDDKSGVLGALEAMESLLADGFRPERTIYLAFGHDEEVGGEEGAAEIVELLASRGVELYFAIDEGGVVRDELFPGLDHPVAVIGVAEKGFVNARLVVEAAGGHSSQPPPQTALGILARAIVRVEDHPFPTTLDYLGMTVDAVGHEAPFSQRAVFGNLWLTRHMVETQFLKSPVTAAITRTTTAATMAEGSSAANVLPTRAEAVINFRTLPGDTGESVHRRLVDIIDDERVEVQIESTSEASPVSPQGDAYGTIASTLRGMDVNLLVAPYLVIGGTDARYYTRLTPNVYRFMMMRADDDTVKRMHGVDERIEVDDYLEMVRFYAHLMRRAG